MAVFNWITATNVTPGTTGSYQDVDLDTYVADLGADVTGVILQVFGNGSAFGARCNGSTDNRNYTIANSSMVWAMCGVDANHIFEVNSPAANLVYLVGYTKTGCTFQVNATDKSLAGVNAWTDVDCSAVATDAIGLIFENQNNYSASGAFGWRKNGSTDNRLFGYSLHEWTIIGCDAGHIAEGYIANTAMDCWLVGWVTDGATFNTNGIDKSAASTNSYLDTTLSTGATGGFLEWGQDNYTYAVRPNGASYDYVKQCYYHPWSLCGADAGKIIEIKVSSTNVDCWEVGISTAAVTPTVAVTGTITSSATEADIVTGGKTIILTVTNDTWVATVCADNAITTALIAGIDSAQAEATGWDAVVKANMVYTDTARTSDTVVTITLGDEPTYDITATETITVTVPATALTLGGAIVAAPTFTVSAVTANIPIPIAMHHYKMMRG